MDLQFLKYHKFSLLLLLSGIAFYFAFSYDLERTDFIKLITLYAALFAVSFKLIQLEKRNFLFLAIAAIVFRLIFLVAFPNLSQDFYRFIWDGNSVAEGINPYLNTPYELLKTFAGGTEIRQKLINGMGSLSAGNYTSYPPVNQLLFAASSWLSGESIPGSVIAMRSFIIAADLGILYFGRKLLLYLKLPAHRIFWYILNPFIIIELTGNLHFEGIMLFFLIWSLYLLHLRKWIPSAVLLGISISIKLLPLLFLPLFLRYFKKPEREIDRINSSFFEKIDFKKLSGFYLITIATAAVTFLPFLSSEFFQNFFQSIGLWFQKFEYNASVFYVLRWIGFELAGFNVIRYAGIILPVITTAILIHFAFFRRNENSQILIASMMLGISFYFFLSTTIHPWYLATPLLLSIFGNYRYILVWTLVVILSYSAYSNPEFQENLWLVALEYLVVFSVLIWEVFQRKKFTA
ncbi:polyprenol phosphomannose-dependent alpha 1,6 mannosyltransferase MptB [Autumnicola psychrophila]|uniref:Polyprenol phosphomannose-dependent alpha 1,6 mannosyltransferase MptB n=1 Tax=Autumnicola psychrophila TaxID=3075592 RepID=A0ABU3DV13_9FLAO|nr:polyprenol phosphomannose-dependent alpha 1,6 mannosyltransferase MptB [Zunongwangia sp. F225]MDT0687520.1 polyprenol phosphomannose-dependent alpha 1,6 mannosyltransferase MptB [Zunongwangia sp. F225]